MDLKANYTPAQLEQFAKYSSPSAIKRRAQAGFTKPVIEFGKLSRIDGVSDTYMQRSIEKRTNEQKSLDRLAAMEILADAMESLRARAARSIASYRHATAHCDWEAGVLYVQVPRTAMTTDPMGMNVVYGAFSRIRELLGDAIELAVFLRINSAPHVPDGEAEPRKLGRPRGVHGGHVPGVSDLAAQLMREKRAKDARERRALARLSKSTETKPVGRPKKVREQVAELREKDAIEAAKPPRKRGRPMRIKEEIPEVPVIAKTVAPIKPEDDAKAGTVGKPTSWDAWKDIEV